MQQSISIIGVLFPTILLVMVNFDNRYTALANLIRNLNVDVYGEHISPKDAQVFYCEFAVFVTGCA